MTLGPEQGLAASPSVLPVTNPEHGQPGPTARPGPTSYFGLTGRAWAEKSGPIDMTGRAWASDLVKARPDGPTIYWPDEPGLGWEIRPDCRAGPRPLISESGFLLAQPDPARPDNMPTYSHGMC
jgi:hypothetical protein